MKTVLILGSTGQIGHTLYTYLKQDKEKYDVIGISRTESPFTDYCVNIETELFNLETLIKTEKPDVVINCIGLLIEESQKYPDRANYVNNLFPHWLEALVKNTPIYLIHVSTNCVFEGIKPIYYENSIKDGTSIYAQTKGLGEIINSKDLTIRTSTIGGETKNGISLLDWFNKQNGTIYGYSNMFWNGVTTPIFSMFVNQFIDKRPTGVIHLSHWEIISKLNLLRILKDVFNKKIIIEKKDDFKQTKILKPNKYYTIPHYYSYKNMINNLGIWIKNHKNIYGDKYEI